MTGESRVIPGFDGLYAIVDYKDVWSYTNDIFLQKTKKEYGYESVKLSKNGIMRSYGIHRIVAITYVPIPERLKDYPLDELDVHHDNFDPTDNRPENLRWLTRDEHNKLHKSIPVYQYKLNGEFVREWPSLMEVHRQLGFDASSMSRCARFLQLTSHGYQWRYTKHDRIPAVKSRYERIGEKHSKQVAQYDLDGNLIKIWPSMVEIQRQLGYFSTAISACCRGVRPTAYGFIWKYA